MSDFGRDNPREMPAHLFAGSVRLDYATAVRADPAKQNCSICPRYWYLDATFSCARCAAEFQFTASEQRVWYEQYRFWIDSVPRQCPACRRDMRQMKALRQEYDERVLDVLEHGSLDSKKQLASVIDQLYELGNELPGRIHEARRRLAIQIAREEQSR